MKWTILSNVCTWLWLITAVRGGHNYDPFCGNIWRTMRFILPVGISEERGDRSFLWEYLKSEKIDPSCGNIWKARRSILLVGISEEREDRSFLWEYLKSEEIDPSCGNIWRARRSILPVSISEERWDLSFLWEYLNPPLPRHLLGSHTVLGISVPWGVNFALFMAYSFSYKSSYP